MSNVTSIVKAIQDLMRKDAGIDGDAQRISQLAWMFFLKIVDDRDQELELLQDGYVSPVPTALRWSSWAANEEGLTGDRLLSFVSDKLFPGLRGLQSLGEEGARVAVIRSVFEDATTHFKSGVLLRQVCNKINGIDFNSLDDRHTFGDVYEQILRDLQNAGNSGEFYTPRAVTRFMVEMIDPKLSDVVLDPACGTGGFLAQALDHKIEHYVSGPADYEQLRTSIRGVEKKGLPHILCVTNMMVHGLETPTNIRRGNTLARPLRDYAPSDKVSVIITNPPFGGVEEDGIEKNFPTSFQTRETADLFLVLIMSQLEKNGRAAVVLPDGFLFGEGVKTRIKEELFRTCNLHTIIRLPNGVFNPYTNIRTNILFFEKGTSTTETWFYEHPYPEGYRNYSKTKPLRIEEFAATKLWWGDIATRSGRSENACAWRVPIEQIRERGFNLDFDNPNKVSASYSAPAVLDEELIIAEKFVDAVASELLATFQGVLDNAKRIDRAVSDKFVSRLTSLATGREAIAKFRELTLQLAVQGHLTSTDTSDTPIDDLLELVERERDEHVTTGIGKIRKPVEKVAPDNPFPVPATWRWVPLDTLASYIQRGKGPKYVEDSSVRIVSQKCVQWSGFTIAPAKYLDESAFETYGPERLLRSGDLLWNSTGTGTIGRVNIFPDLGEHGPVVADSHVTVVRPLVVSSDYLWCYLASPFIQRTLESDASGSTNQVELSTSVVRQTPIPLPPLAEQLRVVEHVSGLMVLCDKLDIALARMREARSKLLDSLVHHLVTTTGEISPDAGPSGGSTPSGAGNMRPSGLPRLSTSGAVGVGETGASAPGDSKAISPVLEEAALVTAIVSAFFERSGEPIGNFRLQKAFYFVQRKLGKSTHIAFLKKAAGPYNPSLKYQGGIPNAISRKAIRQARGRYGFGYVPGELSTDAFDGNVVGQFSEAAAWVRDTFQFKENDEWELLATVDYAAAALEAKGQQVSAESVLDYIASEPEWSGKVSRLALNAHRTASALMESRALLYGTIERH